MHNNVYIIHLASNVIFHRIFVLWIVDVISFVDDVRWCSMKDILLFDIVVVDIVDNVLVDSDGNDLETCCCCSIRRMKGCRLLPCLKMIHSGGKQY